MATVFTLGLYMAGLGLGGWWAGKQRWRPKPIGYGVLEILVAGWAIAFPWLLSVMTPVFLSLNSAWGTLICVTPLLLPPAFAHGATLPSLAPTLGRTENIARLYAVNTCGAVLGVILSAFWWMPALGIRGTEIVAALCSLMAGAGALLYAQRQTKPTTPETKDAQEGSIPWRVMMACGVAGAASMSLEILWSRIGSLLIGGSVYTMAIVLAVFLAGIALGAEWGKRKGASVLPFGLLYIGLLATLGTYFWRILPHGLGVAWDWFGESSQLPAGAFLLALAMCGAPIASGMVFGSALQSAPNCSNTKVSGNLLAINTLCSVIGIFLCGTVGMPLLGIRGMVFVISAICVGTAMLFSFRYRLWYMLAFALLWIFGPQWDHAIYSVGIYNRIGSLKKHDPRYIERYAHRGWTLEYYKDGKSASVAVGKSKRTGNLWLSINGKVDASTGADMPTQQLSGELPLTIAKAQENKQYPTLIVGLASGVTAAEALTAGATSVDILEIEPAVVESAALFSAYNNDILQHPQANIIVQDARAFLAQGAQQYQVIISEPSNPWLTGISNLFTVEYWKLGRKRLAQDGVFCQWVQLYNMPPNGFRSLIQSYLSVFPNTWLFETIPGADVLLISAPSLPAELPIAPTLGPTQLKKLAQDSTLNTDDQPLIEFEAPKWINRPTGQRNKKIIDAAKDD